MSMTSTNFADLHDKEIKQVFFNNLIKKNSIYDMFSNVISTTTKREKFSSVTGLDYLPEANEGASYTSDELEQKYDKTFTPLTHKANVRITSENYADDLTGTFKKIPMMMGLAANATVERNFALQFDRSQSSSYTGPDSKALCATDHPMSPATADTFSNRPSTNIDIAQGSIEDAISAMMAYTDDRGIPGGMEPKYLMVPPATYITACKILQSQQVTASANNDKNVISDYGIKVIKNVFLTDTDSWYLVAAKDETSGLFTLWRERPSVKNDMDPDNDDAIIKVRMRVVHGWIDPRQVYGSVGI